MPTGLVDRDAFGAAPQGAAARPETFFQPCTSACSPYQIPSLQV